MLFGVSSSLVDKYPENTEDQILNLKEYDYTGTCEYDDCHDYDDGTYKGKYDVWDEMRRDGRQCLRPRCPAEGPRARSGDPDHGGK